ncbi:CoA transferase [Microbacterium foliorum]|uniref:E-cinnamoyl-CoA:R-phenyllactate CoA transferase n=1 Tax=Microbacterium foliorum TaxID=104336 RepID=A0A0F0L2G7_9MICO|nr:CoA transferase [Microbacterium foliorum]KJL26580.1 E-cinnamoyl-CoA:R-phenyllactate CoA transferase [Microbacterium foliorum]
MIRTPSVSPAASILRRVRADLGIAESGHDDGDVIPGVVPLPSRLAVGDLAWASVRACGLVADIGGLPDPERVAVAYRSDRVLTVDGTPPDVWSVYSGFWRTADGWVRTHGNYPHHARRLRDGLGLGTDADAHSVRAALLALTSHEAVDRITVARGLAVPVREEDPRDDERRRTAPLLAVEHMPSPTPRSSPDTHRRRGSGRIVSMPLAGVRVLDLTRVIAGPVCTRTLALLGADVLRIDPPHLAEPEWQHLDTGHGKRSAVLDARSGRFEELLAAADVVVLGYRPAALERLGLSPSDLVARHPGLVIAQLSAWGDDEPHRAGFDSLVQAESGIAMIESADGERPGALPAQALDHSAGYLLAAAVINLLDRERRDGDSWVVRTSLRRIAAELLGLPRNRRPAVEPEIDLSAHTAAFEVGGHRVSTARPALPGAEFAAPHLWGSDQPVW